MTGLAWDGPTVIMVTSLRRQRPHGVGRAHDVINNDGWWPS
jgi:hypothetical protein